MDQRLVVRQRGLEVGESRKRLVLDLDRVDCPARDLGREGGDGGDDVGLEPHLLLGEEAPILDELSVQDVRDVLVCQDGEHAGDRSRSSDIDADDPCVRVVGVAELGVQLPGEVEVGRVAAGACDFLLPVRADEGGGWSLRDSHEGEHKRRTDPGPSSR